MNHITFISSLLLIWLIAFVSAKREIVKVLDARGDFVGRTESAEVELNQAVLTEDSKGNLPEKFTICAATFLANWISNFAWFDLLKEDGTHWVFFYLMMYRCFNLGNVYIVLTIVVFMDRLLVHQLWINFDKN